MTLMLRPTTVVMLLLASLASRAAGQGPTIAPLVLATPGSTRALALGDAYTALGADPEVIFYNPAQLAPANAAQLPNTRGISASLQRYGGETSLLTVAATSLLTPGVLGVGVQVLDQAASEGAYLALARRGEAALYDRGATLATGAVATLGYARAALFGTRLGIAGKVVHQQLGNERDVTGAVDVGVTWGSSIQVSLVGRNLGHGIRLGGESIALPRMVALGAAAPRREVGPLDLAATMSAAMLASGSLVAGAGTEWSYMPLDGFTFAGRIGYRAVEGANSHLTLGAGFVGERVGIDYAFQASDGPGSAHRFGVRWR